MAKGDGDAGVGTFSGPLSEEGEGKLSEKEEGGGKELSEGKEKDMDNPLMKWCLE